MKTRAMKKEEILDFNSRHEPGLLPNFDSLAGFRIIGLELPSRGDKVRAEKSEKENK